MRHWKLQEGPVNRMATSTELLRQQPIWQRTSCGLPFDRCEKKGKTETDQSSQSTADFPVTVADVVIVGAGLSGLSAAYHTLVAMPNARVVVLESKSIGHGASTRNSGMLTPGVGQNLAAIVNRYGEEKARQMYITSLDAVRYAEDLADREGLEFGLRMTGQLIVARGWAGRERLNRQALLMEHLDLPCRRPDDAQLSRRLSISLDAPGRGPAALQMPVAGVLDPGQLVRSLAAAVQRRGGIVIENVRVADTTKSGVLLANGTTVRAKKVVVATNGYDLALSQQKGRIVPLHLRMILTRPLSAAEQQELGWQHREGVIDSRRVFNYFRMTDDKRLLLGGGLPRYQWRGCTRDLQTNHPDVVRLHADMKKLFPSLSAVARESTWTGVIAYSRDTLPFIGAAPSQPNTIHVGGWCGHGIALSLYSGRWVAELLRTGRHTFDQSTHTPWFRARAPRIPFELARWFGVRLGGLGTQVMDQVA